MRVETSYAAARLALLDLIAPAISAVKGTIVAGDLPEAQRQIALLQRRWRRARQQAHDAAATVL